MANYANKPPRWLMVLGMIPAFVELVQQVHTELRSGPFSSQPETTRVSTRSYEGPSLDDVASQVKLDRESRLEKKRLLELELASLED